MKKDKKVNIYKPLAFVLLILILTELQLKFDVFSGLHLTNIKGIFGSRDVIAIVNGEKISESEFNATYASLRSTNSNVTEYDILKLLIEQKVLVSKAKELGISVNDSEIEQYLDMYIQQVGGKDSFDSTLESLGLSEDLFKRMLREQIYIQKLFEQYYFDMVNISDEEVDLFVEQQFGSKDALNESVKASLKEALLAQKRIDFIQKVVDDLVKHAKIKFLKKGFGSELFEMQLDSSELQPTVEPSGMNNETENSKSQETAPVEANTENNNNNENNNLGDSIKECIKTKFSEDIDFFVICDDCDMFNSFFKDKEAKAYIDKPNDNTIAIIKDCLSSVYQGYVPEVICLNNGKSLIDNFDSQLESFFESCIQA